MQQQDVLNTNTQQETLPNATTALVLGILSLIFCFAYGVPGLILGIIGLVLANKDRALYNINPTAYSKNSYNNSNAGRVCSIIGICLSLVFILFVAAILIFGFALGGFENIIKH